MHKDDYIHFRCSANLKELAGKQAEERGMNITDYMEYLIRIDFIMTDITYRITQIKHDIEDETLEWE